MADNTTLNTGSGGDVIATDDIGGVKYQRVKISQGADGSATDVSSAAPLNVTLANTGANTNKLLVTPDLPSGAATAAKQPALGTAGTPSADVITIQGKASMTPVLVDGSATTQPVSGTVAVTNSSLTTLAGAVYAEDAASANADPGIQVLSVRKNTAAATSGTDGDYQPLITDTNGRLHVNVGNTVTVDGSGVTQPVSGTVAVTGVATATKQSDGSQKTQVVDGSGNVIGATSNALDINIKSGNPTSIAATQSGTWTVQPGNTANSTPWLANPKDIAATTGSISAADATVASTTNAINQTVLTGTPDANSFVTATLTGQDNVTLQISGNINLTLQFERSTDGGTTYTTLGMEEVGTGGTTVTSLAINENKATFLRANVSGMTNFRVRCTARTSGTATINIQSSWGLVLAAVNSAQVAGTLVDTNSGNKSAGTQRVVLATDQPALTNKLLVTPDSVALPAHQSVNVDQLNGTTTDTNSGTKSAGTLRVVLATDQPQLTNKLLVTPDANSAVNIAQLGGNTISSGVGTSGTGTVRTVVANDTGRTLLSTGGSASSSGNNTLVSAGTNKLKVYAFSLSTTSTTAVTCIFQSGASGTELWRVVLQAPTSVSTGANLVVQPPAWLFATASATLLNLNLSGAQTVHWSVSYWDEA